MATDTTQAPPPSSSPKKFFDVEITRVHLDPTSFEESTDVLKTKFGFTNRAYELLFSELGYSPERHAEQRARFGTLMSLVAKGEASDAERHELGAFDLIDFYGKDRGELTVATDLIWAGLTTANPQVKREEVAGWLTNNETVRILQNVVVPAVFAYFGSDYGAAIAKAKEQAEQLIADAQAEHASGSGSGNA